MQAKIIPPACRPANVRHAPTTETGILYHRAHRARNLAPGDNAVLELQPLSKPANGVSAQLDFHQPRSILNPVMPLQLPQDLNAHVMTAVRHFWDMRATQAGTLEDETGSIEPVV